MKDLDLSIRELQRIFDFFNEKIYKNDLPDTVIAIQTNNRKKSVMGWCTSKRVWNNSDGSESYYEITVAAEFLDYPVEEIVHIMLHEMVHLFCNKHEIKDCSRAGTYHNKKFKREAEEHGLNVSKTAGSGWAETSLKESIYPLIEEVQVNSEFFAIARRLPRKNIEIGEIEEEERKKQSSRKYICPKCETIVRGTKSDINIICGDCKINFEEED